MPKMTEHLDPGIRALGMNESTTEDTVIYECLTCSELVPLGCCTCGPRQRLQKLGGREMYIRKVEMFEVRSDDSKVTHWQGTKKELTALLDDGEWQDGDTVVFARLGAILAPRRTRVKEAKQ